MAVKKSWSVQKVFAKERFDDKYALAVTCDQEVLLPFLKKKKKKPDRRLSRSLQHCQTGLACENIRVSSLFAAGDVSRGGTSATQRQKFHTDDVKSVRNPVRSADWSTE